MLDMVVLASEASVKVTRRLRWFVLLALLVSVTAASTQRDDGFHWADAGVGAAAALAMTLLALGLVLAVRPDRGSSENLIRRFHERRRRGRSMKRKRISGKLLLSLGLAVVAVAGVALIPSVASAEQEAAVHDHAAHAAGFQDELAQVRRVTARFHRVEEAIAAGYELGYVNGLGNRIITACIAHPTAGAMGYHYFNKELIDDLVVDELKPEGLVYAPAPHGGLKLMAVEYVVPGDRSNPPGPREAPTVFGMEMVILVPAVGFHTLHAWVWGHNPAGMFAHWNPEVTCP